MNIHDSPDPQIFDDKLQYNLISQIETRLVQRCNVLTDTRQQKNVRYKIMNISDRSHLLIWPVFCNYQIITAIS